MCGHTSVPEDGRTCLFMYLFIWKKYRLIYYFAAVGGRRTAISVSVCLSVTPLAYLENRTSKFYQLFCTCYLWLWLGLALTAMRYVMYFRFCG